MDMSSSTAIWSMNAPVPPAQEPFIRSSMPPAKKITLASSPPSSITAPVSGASRPITAPVAYTSWMKGRPAASAMPIPAEPDMVTDSAGMSRSARS